MLRTAKRRSCPLYFRYRDFDPAPSSLCGGMHLSGRDKSRQPGIYYETAKGAGDCCPWSEERDDVAYVFYTQRPHLGRVEVACGGFSGRATRCLATRPMCIAPQLWPPQFRSDVLQDGLFLVRFAFRPSPAQADQGEGLREFKHEVIPLSAASLKKRLAGGGEA
jgi:hypothetical protein